MLIKSKKANSYVYLPNNKKAIKTYNELLIKDAVKESIDYKIEILDYVELPNNHSIKKIDEIDSNNNNVCRISNEDIVYPLYVRTRKYGDKMQLKKSGTRRIKDIFIDQKIPSEERDKWPVVVDSCDKVIWIPGIKKSKFTKQKNETYDIILKYD
jgi:bifunctional protein TilS/HprT